LVHVVRRRNILRQHKFNYQSIVLIGKYSTTLSTVPTS
jgi:hypothetical protein